MSTLVLELLLKRAKILTKIYRSPYRDGAQLNKSSCDYTLWASNHGDATKNIQTTGIALAGAHWFMSLQLLKNVDHPLHCI